MKFNLKKLISLFMLVVMMLSLSGCAELGDMVGDIIIEIIDSSTTPSVTPNEDDNSQNISVTGDLEIHFIDVGQADCILIKNKEQSMLIDAGNNDDASLVKQYLTNQKITKLDYVIGTHPHEDHIGSLDVVINNFDIGTIIMPNKVSTTRTFEDVIEAIENKKLSITEPKVGDKYTLGDAEFVVLGPCKDYDDTNAVSVVIRLVYGENSFMLTGDAEELSEEDILETGLTLKSDVLKFGHHGSSTSTSKGFLEAVSPKYGVLLCGVDNSYGHPHKETLDKISKYKIETYRTDEQGTIILTSDGKNITWKTEKNSSTSSTQKEVKYILNTNSKKFHYETCSGIEKISKENREAFYGTREEIISEGYSACGTCKP